MPLENHPSYGPSMSGDGRYIAFDSNASLDPLDVYGSVDVYVRDRNVGSPTQR